MLEFKYDTQLLIEGTNLDEDEINDYITEHFTISRQMIHSFTMEADMITILQ